MAQNQSGPPWTMNWVHATGPRVHGISREMIMHIGYTMLCEQTPPKQLVSDLVQAEEIGFGFSVISDHYFPWLEEQGHSAYAWSVLGADLHWFFSGDTGYSRDFADTRRHLATRQGEAPGGGFDLALIAVQKI